MNLRYSDQKELPIDALISLYRSVRWSSAGKPGALCTALANSDAVVSAWDGSELIGLGNALSDGHLVVYYPHLLVRPEWQRRGIGRTIMQRLMVKYEGFHQHILVADAAAFAFYERLGFARAGRSEPMWIYTGTEH